VSADAVLQHLAIDKAPTGNVDTPSGDSGKVSSSGPELVNFSSVRQPPFRRQVKDRADLSFELWLTTPSPFVIPHRVPDESGGRVLGSRDAYR